ncbi:MAG: porin OmpL1, partial [Myxococcota bacterium]
ASLGSTIAQDGTVAVSDTTVASLIYSVNNALMSDRDNMVLWHSSENTNSAFRLVGEEPKIGSAMLGVNLGVSAQYELDDVLGLPLYVKTGFHYIDRISGGAQTRVLGDAAAADPVLAGLFRANGEDPNDYINGVMSSNYDASWFEVPVTVGLKVPLKGDLSFVYGGIGVSYFRGGFSVELDIDERYANVLGTHVDSEAGTVSNFSAGAVRETVEFSMASLGLNWSVGAQAAVNSSAVLFVELNSSGTSRTVYSNSLTPEGRQLMTALSSQSLASEDPQWFKRLAYPVVAGGASVRFGLRYYLF